MLYKDRDSVMLFLKRIIDFVVMLLRSYLLPSFGFSKTLTHYGEWAVVTGATDGIGKEYAKQLGARGLNVVLISRTKSKLESLAMEIKSDSNVDVKVIVFDFAQQYGYEVIEEKLKDLDVGILVNNVGMNYPGNVYFQNSDIEVVADILNVNIISLVKMTRILVSGMVGRKRGAVVHISSSSVFVPTPFFNVYPSSKIFVNKFVKSLQIEESPYIDHQIVTPFFVQSKLSKAEPSFTVPTAEQFVKSAIATIGVVDITCGCFVHEILKVVVQCIPPAILVPLIINNREKRYKNN